MTGALSRRLDGKLMRFRIDLAAKGREPILEIV